MVQRSRYLEKEQGRAHFARVSRRSWLGRVFLGLTAVPSASKFAWSAQAAGTDSDDKEEIARVQVMAKKAGLGPFAHSRTVHFLGLGDANDRFRNAALSICESLAPEFLKHFSGKGFELALPKNRLTVITLKSAESYQAFIGEDPGATVGGHYDLDTNRLVMFDFRPQDQGPAVVNNPRRVNLLTLVHETTHLLCYNTGMLSRQTDVPDWVSEGLATYVELWRNGKTPIGATNRPWLLCLRAAKKNDWVPITDLVADGQSFNDKQTAQLSYAESWLMVHYLMKRQLVKFRSYLAGLATEEAVSNRVKYAESQLGPLKNLEHELVRHFKRVSR